MAATARLALVVAVLSSALLPGIVEAHARFVGSSPVAGAELPAGPDRIVLNFNQPVQPVAVRLIDGAGVDRVAGSVARAVDSEVIVELAGDLDAGTYLLSYRVLSADAHPIAASFSFSVATADPPGATPLVPVPAEQVLPAAGADWSFAEIAARAMFMIGLLLSAGWALFIVLVPLPGDFRIGVQKMLARVSLATLVAAAVYLQVGGAQMLGSDRLPELAALELALQSSLGTSLTIAAIGLIVLVVASRYGAEWLLFSGAAFLVVSRAFTGHPASREPGWALMPAMVMHVSAAAFWYGSLWPLFRSLRRLPPPVAAAVLQRFSIVAMTVVAALALAGILMALIHIATPSALLDTWYGQLLIMKTTWFSVLLALAAWHKLRLTPKFAAGDEKAGRRLRASLLLEAVIMTLVLLISVNLASTAPEDPPASDIDDEAAVESSVAVTSMTGNYTMELDLGGLMSSPRQIVFAFSDPDGIRLSPLEVMMTAAVPELGIEPFPVPVRVLGDGLYSSAPAIEVGKAWRLTVDALVTDFDQESFVIDVAIPGQ